MTPPPLCRSMGRHCHALAVTLRVAELEPGAPASADGEATWLLGHTERMRFGTLYRRGGHLYVRSTLHVPCRHLATGVDGGSTCRMFGYRSRLPRPRHQPQTRQLGEDRFVYVRRGRTTAGPLPAPPPPRGSLPVLGGSNPCATARCRTSDHRIGAACCRDLQLEIMCPPWNERLESLVRHRRSPLLCKVDREAPDSLSVEVISACGFLGSDGVSCSLHGRTRPDGSRAKPDLCYDWPGREKTLHPGCVLAPRPTRFKSRT